MAQRYKLKKPTKFILGEGKVESKCPDVKNKIIEIIKIVKLLKQQKVW